MLVYQRVTIGEHQALKQLKHLKHKSLLQNTSNLPLLTFKQARIGAGEKSGTRKWSKGQSVYMWGCNAVLVILGYIWKCIILIYIIYMYVYIYLHII